MPMPMLSDYLAACQGECETEMQRLFGAAHPGATSMYDLILDYPLRGGKGLRPTLAIGLCLGLGGQLSHVLPTAATLELYHNAFLIHDDIEDESLLRRGKPALHIEHGIPIAINVGDAMMSLSLQPLLDNVERVGLGRSLKILRAVANMTRRTVEGQSIELGWVRNNTWQLQDTDYLVMVELKTSWYSFITPMQCGALAAGAGPEQLGHLERFGRHLGSAFQITDDLLNLQGDPEEYGKEIGGDLWEGKRTLMLLHALRSAAADDRDQALAILDRGRPSHEGDPWIEGMIDRLTDRGDLTRTGRADLLEAIRASPTRSKTIDEVRWMHELLTRSGSLDHARRIAQHEAALATEAFDALTWLPSSEHREMLGELVDYVHERTR